MGTFSLGARASALAIFAALVLTGCKKADEPQFTPAPGTYTGTQNVAMSSPTLAATIVYTTDGSAPSCQKQHGIIYVAPVPITVDTTLRAMACAPLRDESVITKGTYIIKAPEPVHGRTSKVHHDGPVPDGW